MIYYGTPRTLCFRSTRGLRITGSTSPTSKPQRQTVARQPGPYVPVPIPHVRGPRQNNIDIALIKQTRIGEGKNIEFRAEALNAGQPPAFPEPQHDRDAAQSVKDTGFGQISASTMNNYARRLQMSLRFLF
jgi:hypothetical protein